MGRQAGGEGARHQPEDREHHKTRIYSKLGVPNQAAAAGLAARALPGTGRGRVEPWRIYLSGVRRRWKVILAAVVISMAVAVSSRQRPYPVSQEDEEQFEASVLLLDARGSGFGVKSQRHAGREPRHDWRLFTTLDDGRRAGCRTLARESRGHRPSPRIHSMPSADTETASSPSRPPPERPTGRTHRQGVRSVPDRLPQRPEEGRFSADRFRVLERELDQLEVPTTIGGDRRPAASLQSQVSTLEVQLADAPGAPGSGHHVGGGGRRAQGSRRPPPLKIRVRESARYWASLGGSPWHSCWSGSIGS